MKWFSNLILSMPNKFIPFLSWIGDIRKIGILRADIIGGITVALVLVPQSMAYASLAGLPAYYGLYASFLPPMVAALFGSSRQLATGPVAVVSLMTAATLEPLAVHNPNGFLVYALTLAMLVGLFQLLLGLLKLGVLVDLLSHPVVLGFTNAGAIIIATSQLDKLFGVNIEKASHHYETVYNTIIAAFSQTHWQTLAMGVLAISIMISLKRFLPKFPNVLIAVVITTLLSYLTNFKDIGGDVVGLIPAGLPNFVIPVLNTEIVKQLMMSAIIISLVGFMEAISIAKAMAAKTRQQLDANQELVGQGISNIVSSMSSGYPVSGSFSRSAVNINAGAITGFSSIVTGLVVGFTLFFLTPLLYHLPKPTLAAVIILAVINLIKFKPIIHAWKALPHDGIIAIVTFILTLILAPHLEFGILAGVVLSLLLFLFRTMRPRVAELSRYKDGTMRDIEVHNLPVSKKISIIRFDNSLYFANAGFFENKILEVQSKYPKLRYIILDAEGINHIDSTGEEVLHHLVERLRVNGIELIIARMKRQFVLSLRRTGLIKYIDEGHFFSRITYALDYVWDALGQEYDRTHCPLRRY